MTLENQSIINEHIDKLKEYFNRVLEQNSSHFDLNKIIMDAYILAKDSEYENFNIQDLCIEISNNLVNPVKKYDTHICVLVEFVNKEIHNNELISHFLQSIHFKAQNLVFKHFNLIFFDNILSLKQKKELIIKNSFNEYYSLD